ncbi:MAG: GNAT family N-acetyltransferase [Acidimicrobiales bacterium]|jgi:GNAT superfamily N-acetyltransferase
MEFDAVVTAKGTAGAAVAGTDDLAAALEGGGLTARFAAAGRSPEPLPTTADPTIGPAELRAMQALASRVWARHPSLVNTGATVGELAWNWGSNRRRSGSKWRSRLLREGADVVAWGWLSPPELVRVSADRLERSDASLIWQVHPDRPELLGGLLDWLDDEAGDTARETTARAEDAAALEQLRRHGYEQDAGAPWSALNLRSLDDIAEPRLPAGFSMQTMARLGDVSRRVAVHRAAWHPSGLREEIYADVMATWPYRAELDVVVQAPDGSLAASVLAWYDEATGVGEFEPVGTHPAHRRQGLGRAASLFAMQALRELGAAAVAVSCRGDDDYPAPRRLYESAGFRRAASDLVFRKRT